jgi:putative ABC transport system permease protein
MGTLWQDVRYAFRIVAKNPGFTAVVVLILAVAIGANTAIFSVVNAVMLRPLPYEDSRRLVFLDEHTQWGDLPPAHGRFLAWREQNQVFESMAAINTERPYVTGIDKARQIWAATVSPELLPLLGVQPFLGRGFRPEEVQPGNDRVVVLSHTFWRDDLGGTPEVIGKTVTLDDKSYTIIGVLPAGFVSPISRPAVYMPLVFKSTPDEPLGEPIVTLARLKAGTTLKQARAAMAVIADRLKQTDSQVGAEYGIVVGRLLDRHMDGKRKLPLLLLGAAGFVLLIACSNVANLFLARAAVRQREMAMRAALGASTGRVLRQLLTESLLLSVGGGALGLLMTFWTVRGLVRLCPANIPRLNETSVDWRVLVFTLGISIFTGLVFGAIPAWRAAGARMTVMLQEGTTRSSTGRRGRHLHGGLVVAQMGLSLILLIGAALLIRSLVALYRLDLGFRPENTLAVLIELPEQKYPEPGQRQVFFETLLPRVRALAHVRSAGLSLFDLGLGAGGFGSMGISIPGRSSPSPEHRDPAQLSQITAGFLETLGVQLLRGRPLTEEDVSGQTSNIIIDEYFARKYFADTDPIGQRIDFPDSQHFVVGVVGTVKDFQHLDRTEGTVYVPMSRDMWFPEITLLVRTDGDPTRLADAIRAQVAELEKDEVIRRVQTVEAMLSGMLTPRRFVMILLSLFAGIALILATVGVYGLLHYSATQQTREIAIRMALGAERASVRRMVLGQGLRLTLLGVTIGVAGAVALTRVLSSLLYDVTPTDPLTLVCVSLVLIGVALLASYLPARRASRVDPMAALRCE